MHSITLSENFSSLFPAGVVAAELRGDGDASLLLPAEMEYLSRAVPKRVKEFAAGRACARRAMAEFGIDGFALRVAPDRQPVWPAGLVGSITHTEGICAAVVGRCEEFSGLGVDTEIVGHVSHDIWHSICTVRELAWLDSLPAAQRAAAVTLVFAAKEAFYKCQYPITREWLDFHDLCVEVRWGAAEATFSVAAERAICVAATIFMPLLGRYRLHEGYASAGIAIAATAIDGAAGTGARRVTAVSDRAVIDGAVSDGAVSDGAVSDGAVSDGAVMASGAPRQ